MNRFDIETKLGNIHFSHNIINRIVENAIAECDGKVLLQNYRGGLNASGVEFIETENGFRIKVYIVIKFGTSIKQTTSKIIDSIYENAEKILGEKPEKIKVIVTGVASKNIARRHIEVIG